MSGQVFCSEFTSQWRQDRDEELAKAESWPRRYDLDLIAAQQRGEISVEEFSRAWGERWEQVGHEHLHAMVDRVFSACDAYQEDAGPGEITEKDLREEVRACLGAFELDERERGRG